MPPVFYSYCVPAFAKSLPALSRSVIPVKFTGNNKAAVIYFPNTCAGRINDIVDGKSALPISVSGKIKDSLLSVEMKILLMGTALTTVGNTTYLLNDR